ncbi:hypothetical protein LTR27_010606 [Elasticomyces elasticus]|nr:hypothetical protein LTR27_010606 [Elasticomyces elasticus]
MAPTLTSIPPEMLEMVAKCLDPENDYSYALLKLRLSKLCELEDIASSAELASRVTDLDFICEPSTTKTPDWSATLEDTARQPDFTALALPLSVLLAKFPQLATIIFVKGFYATEPKDDQRQTYKWDTDATVQATIGALAMVGVQPTTISTEMCPPLSKDQSWFCLRPHLDLLHRLDLSVFLDREHGVNVDKIGMNFLLALQQCTVLEELFLSLGYSNEVRDAFDCLASAVILPRLRRFAFSQTACNTPTMMRFLNNHAATLRSCEFGWVEFWRRGAVDFTNLLAMMSERMSLDKLAIEKCSEGQFPLLTFPNMIKVSFDSEPNDDGYVVVDLDETISLEGHDKVQSGLACMLKCVEVL